MRIEEINLSTARRHRMISYNELRDGQEFYGNGYKKGYEKGYEDAKKDFERPQGEWVIGEEWITPTDNPTDDYKVTTYTCPFCGRVEYTYFDYCRCGAKMGNGGKDKHEL